jgi:hypothetical protein
VDKTHDRIGPTARLAERDGRQIHQIVAEIGDARYRSHRST